MVTRLRWLVKNSIETKHRNCESGSCVSLDIMLVFGFVLVRKSSMLLQVAQIILLHYYKANSKSYL